jgi:hypothetical protein
VASKSQMTGMRGVYLVAAELSRIGFVVSPTSRSAIGADLLVTDQLCRRAYSVQVKTNASTYGFWLIGGKAKDTVSDSHVYVLVNIRRSKRNGTPVEYFVLSSKQLSRLGTHHTKWPHIGRDRILNFENAWSVFGEPT